MATGREIKEIYDMMQQIYDETSKLISVINDMFVNEEFLPVGDGSVMWNKSNHYLSPKYWLPYFMQRVFTKKAENPKRGLGINIMFDGSIDGLENRIPFLTCGLVEFPKDKVMKGNALYQAGWTEHEEIKKEFKGNLCTTLFTDGVTCTSYFLPVDVLTSQEKVQKFIINPLICLYNGDIKETDNMVKEVAIGIDGIMGSPIGFE